jgi:HlyD family secretion protein
MNRYLLPLLAILGLAGTVAAIVVDNRQPAAQEPQVVPASSPYASFVVGAGLIEASTGNISIGSPVAGVAAELDVHVGDFVESGEPLFRVDNRDLQAQLVTARARVAAAKAALEQPLHQLSFSEELAKRDAGAVTVQALTTLRDQVTVAEADLNLAEAEVTQLNLEIERYVVRAPMAGRVLQLNLRAGEYVNGGTAPLVIFGDDRTLFVRVDIDESDAWRVDSGANATAFLRGNSMLRIPLKFEYIEPHITPKISLTGRGTERSDTRVLQVLYSFERDALPVYVGQQLDVFIEAPPIESPGAAQDHR